MKILHTADWHIGQNFYDYDRKEEHLLFFEWLIDMIEHEHIDVMLIAGDIFDIPNPSAESQRIFYTFLNKVSRHFPKLHILITAGNHDSAARLEAPNPLLETMNVTVRGVVVRNNGEIDWDRHIIKISDQLIILAVPYLRQGDYPSQTNIDMANHREGVERFYNELINYSHAKYGTQIPIIAMGHLQAIGANLSDKDKSERVIIGGLEDVSTAIFKDRITYTALGHLHKAQRVGQVDNIWYSGSPLPMSFAEINYKHGINVIEINPNSKKAIVNRCLFPNTVPLISIPEKGAAPMDQILEVIEELPEGEITGLTPYVEINVLNDGPDPTRKNKINNALKNKAVRLTAIHAVNLKPSFTETDTKNLKSLDNMSPEQLALRVYSDKYNTPMPQELQTLLREAIQETEHSNINK